jgi:hypothetical protein
VSPDDQTPEPTHTYRWFLIERDWEELNEDTMPFLYLCNEEDGDIGVDGPHDDITVDVVLGVVKVH